MKLDTEKQAITLAAIGALIVLGAPIYHSIPMIGPEVARAQPPPYAGWRVLVVSDLPMQIETPFATVIEMRSVLVETSHGQERYRVIVNVPTETMSLRTWFRENWSAVWANKTEIIPTPTPGPPEEFTL